MVLILKMRWYQFMIHITGESQNEHRAVLAFLSDLTAAYTPASNQPRFDIAVGTSLNHSIWFHRNVNVSLPLN